MLPLMDQNFSERCLASCVVSEPHWTKQHSKFQRFWAELSLLEPLLYQHDSAGTRQSFG